VQNTGQGEGEPEREQEPDYPFTGEVVRLVPGQEMETRLVLDVGKHVFLADHAFIKVPEDLKPTEERLPTLPMTFGIEIIAETAAQLVPGMQVIGCQDVEASRWIALISQRTLTLNLRARRLSETVVEVEVRTEDQKHPALRGKVTLGPALPAPPALREVSALQPCEHRAEELYSIPLLFHGRRFHIITGLVGTTDTTLVADFTLRDPQELVAGGMPSLPIFDPVLADGLGQVIGYKLLLDDWVVYPLRLGRLTRYGPTPPPGSVVRMHARYRKLDGRRVEMEADVLDPSGHVWLRLDSWQVWRILWPRELSIFSRQPRKHRVGVSWPNRNPQADCCRMMKERFGEISPEWIARYCLPASEWQTYQRSPRFDWLLARIAVKDAVRDWFRKHRQMVLLHLEIEIGDSPDGRPIVVAPAEKGLAAAVACLEDEAIAVAVKGRGAGVDLAVVGADPGETFDAQEESALSAAGGDLPLWRQRAACARRALGRALGNTGATSRVCQVSVDGLIELETSGEQHAVETHVDGKRVFAVVTIQ
jgi:hypothetical protein